MERPCDSVRTRQRSHAVAALGNPAQSLQPLGACIRAPSHGGAGCAAVLPMVTTLLLLSIILNLLASAVNVLTVRRTRRVADRLKQTAARAIGFTMFVAGCEDLPPDLRDLARTALPPDIQPPTSGTVH